MGVGSVLHISCLNKKGHTFPCSLLFLFYHFIKKIAKKYGASVSNQSPVSQTQVLARQSVCALDGNGLRFTIQAVTPFKHGQQTVHYLFF
jgi:hypothetical protein